MNCETEFLCVLVVFDVAVVPVLQRSRFSHCHYEPSVLFTVIGFQLPPL